MKRMTTLVPAIPCQARERGSLAFILLIILFLSGCKTSKKVGTVASGSAKKKAAEGIGSNKYVLAHFRSSRAFRRHFIL